MSINYFQSKKSLASASLTSRPTEDDQKKSLLSLSEFNESYIKSTGTLATVLLVFYFVLSISTSYAWFGFNPLDSVYYSVITFSTVGYGDFVPKTNPERLYVSFLILIGVGVGSSLISTLNERIYDHAQKMAELRNIRTANEITGLIRRFSEAGDDTNNNGNNSSNGSSGNLPVSGLGEGGIARKTSFVLKSGISAMRTSITLNNDGSNETASPINRVKSGGILQSTSLDFNRSKNRASVIRTGVTSEALKTIYNEQFQADLKELRGSAIINAAVVIALVTIGSLGMSTIEGWETIKAIYWSTVTISTVGYGDVVPTTDVGKIFTIIYVLSSCAFMAKTVSDLVKFPVLLRSRKNELKFLNQFADGLSKEQLQSVFESKFFLALPNMRLNPAEMSKSEFCLLILHLMSKVEMKDLILAGELFDQMDVDHTGKITAEVMDQEIRMAKTDSEKREEVRKRNEANSFSLTDKLLSGAASSYLSSSAPRPMANSETSNASGSSTMAAFFSRSNTNNSSVSQSPAGGGLSSSLLGSEFFRSTDNSNKGLAPTKAINRFVGFGQRPAATTSPGASSSSSPGAGVGSGGGAAVRNTAVMDGGVEAEYRDGWHHASLHTAEVHQSQSQPQPQPQGHYLAGVDDEDGEDSKEDVENPSIIRSSFNVGFFESD